MTINININALIIIFEYIELVLNNYEHFWSIRWVDFWTFPYFSPNWVNLFFIQLPSTKLFKDTQLSLIFMTELIKTFRFFLRLYLIPVSVNKQDFQYCRNSRPSIVPCINYDVCLSAILSVTSVTASANSREIPQSRTAVRMWIDSCGWF